MENLILDGNIIIGVKDKSITEVKLYQGSGDYIIGKGAFKGCSSLKNIKLYAVYKIGECAFEGCTSLSEVEINYDGLYEIGKDAFKGCPCEQSVMQEIAKERSRIRAKEVVEYINDLHNEINHFTEYHNVEIVDIKYSTYFNPLIDRGTSSALILYKKIGL